MVYADGGGDSRRADGLNQESTQYRVRIIELSVAPLAISGESAELFFGKHAMPVFACRLSFNVVRVAGVDLDGETS